MQRLVERERIQPAIGQIGHGPLRKARIAFRKRPGDCHLRIIPRMPDIVQGLQDTVDERLLDEVIQEHHDAEAHVKFPFGGKIGPQKRPHPFRIFADKLQGIAEAVAGGPVANLRDE